MKGRESCLLSSVVGELLVAQIAHELKNHNLYRSFANFFSAEGIEDLEDYYNKRADEEQLHYEWIYTYLTDSDYKFNHPAVEQNTEVAEDYITPFEATIKREVLTTQLIYRIYEAAKEEKDYMTASWLDRKLIREQIEEENTSRMAKSIISQDADIFVRAKKILSLLK